MRAWVCHHLSSDRSGLRFETDWPEPPLPDADEIMVAIDAAALNYPDLLMLSGAYQFRPQLPFVPGTEAAARIIAVGAGVDRAQIGRPVIVSARGGCLAERVTLPFARVGDRPAGLAMEQAAGFAVGGITAAIAFERGRLAAGERVLVSGAGGGMGLAAVAMAKALGAHVVAAASDEAKLAAARAAGADETVRIARGACDLSAFKERIDVVFDPVGGALAPAALATLAWGGRYLVIGFVGGFPPPVATNRLLLRGIEIIGVRAGEQGRRDPAAAARARAALDRLAADGACRPHIGLIVPMEDADKAFAAMASGTLVGKAVVKVDVR